MGGRCVLLDTDSFLLITLADAALSEAGIPHGIIEFTKSGQSLEMPCAPSVGAGCRWEVLTAKEHRCAAEAVLSMLPVQGSPGQNLCPGTPLSPKAKRWRIYYVLLIAAIGGIVLLLRLLGH